MGVQTEPTDTADTMANNIRSIQDNLRGYSGVIPAEKTSSNIKITLPFKPNYICWTGGAASDPGFHIYTVQYGYVIYGSKGGGCYTISVPYSGTGTTHLKSVDDDGFTLVSNTNGVEIHWFASE